MRRIVVSILDRAAITLMRASYRIRYSRSMPR